MRVRIAVAVAAVLVGTGSLSACNSNGGPASGSSTMTVAASINAWGSILAQLGGTHVKAVSLITNPDTDPHSYEPTPADGRTIAAAQLFVENGVGYDSWADKALEASPNSSRLVVNVGKLVGVPDGGNPHIWYSPSDVEKVADAITADLKRLDPKDAAYFDGQRTAFDTHGLAKYHSLISEIRAKYSGVKVGASESIFAPLAQALGLDLITPASFLKAISEGTDPSPADKSTIDGQIASREIKIYVFNTQNSTPDIAAQVAAAKAKGIPVTGVTETLSPITASFQTWQVTQLEAIAAALHQATGR